MQNTPVDHQKLVRENVQNLIEANREQLITATVPDPNVQQKLLEINRLIGEIKGTDPGKVASWGLGCGGACLSPMGGFTEEAS